MTCLDNILIANAHYPRATLLIFPSLLGDQANWLVKDRGKLKPKKATGLGTSKRSLLYNGYRTLAGGLPCGGIFFSLKVGDNPSSSYLMVPSVTRPFPGLVHGMIAIIFMPWLA